MKPVKKIIENLTLFGQEEEIVNLVNKYVDREYFDIITDGEFLQAIFIQMDLGKVKIFPEGAFVKISNGMETVVYTLIEFEKWIKKTF